MRIGIDGIVLRGRDAGSLRYFEQLLDALGSIDDPNDYVAFASRSVQTALSFPSNKKISYSSVDSNILPAALQQQLYRSWHSRGQLDLLHCPVFVPPLSFTGKTVMTVFDLTFVLFPETKKWTGRMWWQLLGRRGIEKANQVIALSASTQNDLIKWGIEGNKITVVYPYVSPRFKPSINIDETRARYQLPEKYILFVGTLERRKNLPTLIRAFDQARKISGLKHVLVLAGQRGWLYQDIFRTIEELGLNNQVVFLNYFPDDNLPMLYSGADLFVLPSLYEGFGFPILEAMACGAPVLASNVSSLPEIVGDAGALVPPNNVEQIALEIARLLMDRDRAREMAERGIQRAREFSRERFAQGILRAYDDAIKGAQ
jgi:glycosyltransferase involved in cell wall biosynthesis